MKYRFSIFSLVVIASFSAGILAFQNCSKKGSHDSKSTVEGQILESVCKDNGGTPFSNSQLCQFGYSCITQSQAQNLVTEKTNKGFVNCSVQTLPECSSHYGSQRAFRAVCADKSGTDYSGLDFLTKIYATYFLRTPDLEGYNYWLSEETMCNAQKEWSFKSDPFCRANCDPNAIKPICLQNKDVCKDNGGTPFSNGQLCQFGYSCITQSQAQNLVTENTNKGFLNCSIQSLPECSLHYGSQRAFRAVCADKSGTDYKGTDFLTRIYATYFLRTPDLEGYNYWMSEKMMCDAQKEWSFKSDPFCRANCDPKATKPTCP
jgi:hypothetical protein